MHTFSRRAFTQVLIGAATALGVSSLGRSANANDDEFYKGKALTIGISSPPGGTYDAAARLLARHLARYIPGNPAVVPRNILGAGGLTLANMLAHTAPRDGTMIAMHTRGIIQAPMLGDPGAQYDSLDFSWLGTLSSSRNDAYLLVVNRSSGLRNIEDLRKPGDKITLGSVGGITTDVTFALLSPTLFGFNTRLVKGYNGSAEVMLAVRRGELHGTYAGLASLSSVYSEALRSGELLPLLQCGRSDRHPDFPNIPTAQEITADPDKRALLNFVEALFRVALPVSGPPGVPPGRLQLLQTAFLRATADPDYLADASRLRIDSSPLGGDEVREIISTMKSTPQRVIDRYKALLDQTRH